MSYNSGIMFRLIVFDCDGTLFDTRMDIADSVNFARKHFGVPRLSIDEVTTHVGNGVRVLAEKTFSGTGIAADEALAKIMEYYSLHSADRAVPYEGVAETLPLLGNTLAVISNKPKNLVDELLENHGLDKYFQDVIGGDTFPDRKPDPAPLLFLMEKHQAEKGETIVIGDHSPDIEMARNAGVSSIYCNYGFFGQDTVCADYSVNQFSEIRKFL